MVDRFPALASLLLLAIPAAAQKPVLIKDLLVEPVMGFDARPEQLTVAGNTLFFTAYTAATGRELFASASGIGKPYLVKDLVAGSQGAVLDSLCALGNTLFFGFGRQLYRSDGTAAGTVAVVTLPAGVGHMAVVGQRLLIYSNTLWFSDGTAAGTVSLPQTVIATADSVLVGTRRFLVASQASTQPRLWFTDATVAGTAMVPGVNGPEIIGAFSGAKVVFTAPTTQGRATFISDGTAAGTRAILAQEATHAVAWAGNDLLVARTTTGVDLSRFDGTAVRPITSLPGVLWAEPIPAGTNLFLIAASGSSYGDLWRTDATAAGTVPLLRGGLDLRTRPRAFGNQLLMAVDSSPTGIEPWISDGTLLGTRLLVDIYPGSGGSMPDGFTELPGGYAAFRASDGKAGVELWATDGSRRNTSMVADLDPTPSPTLGSGALLSGDDAGRVLLSSRLGLWATDGTGSGTVNLGLLTPGPYFEVAGVGAETLFGGRVQTADGNRDIALIRTDGTAAGTQPVKFVGNGWEPHEFVRLGNHLYFEGGDGATRGLWRTDGTTVGTVFIKAMGIARMIAWRGNLYLRAYASGSYQLLRSDGTANGTVPISGALLMWPQGQLVGTDRHLYFSTSWDLYRTDGTAAGVTQVRDNAQQAVGGGPMVALGGVAYILGWVGQGPLGLVRSDGSAPGTYLLQPAPIDVFDNDLITVAGGQVFFVSSGPAGNELWCSDGTPAGTRRLTRNILLSSFSPPFPPIVAVGRWVYFAGFDPRFGIELWRSDGTVAGTQMVYDLWPGTQSSYPYDFVLSGGSLLFSADDGFHGREPFRIEVPAHAAPRGAGCSTATVPLPQLTASPPELLGTMQVKVAADPARALAGLLVIGWPPARPQAVGAACTLFVDLAQPYLTLPFRTTAGSWSTGIPVLGSAILHGLDLVTQAALGRTSQVPLGVDLSNGVLLALRR